MAPSRRRFGQGLGASLALALLPRPGAGDDRPPPVEVRVSGFAFAPERLEIRAGDVVVWVNDDLAPHTATALDGSWDTGEFGAGERRQVVFETPGDFDYLCAFHPHMTGTVRVLPADHG